MTRYILMLFILGLPLSPGHDINGDVSLYRTRSAVTPRSRSGHSSPVRGLKLSDPGTEPGTLVRCNSDTSLMVNFEGKGNTRERNLYIENYNL